MKHLKIFENLDDVVVNYLYKQMNNDKKEYKGDIKTEYNTGKHWSEKSWIIDEIIQFLSNGSSYTLLKFRNKYSYDTLDSILKHNFKSEYDRAKEILSD